MIKKSFKFFIYFIIISCLTFKTVYAYSFGVPYVSTGDTTSTSVKEYTEGKKANFKTRRKTS